MDEMPNNQYSDYLEISSSFESVVDIALDKRNTNLWREYIVGDDMVKLVDALCQSLGNEAVDARRSFWVHGSYGTGKSYAAIFVKHLLQEAPEVVEDYLSKSARLKEYKSRFMKCRKHGDYLIVWKTACTGVRTGDMLLIELEKSISDALRERYGANAYLGSDSLLEAVKDKLYDRSINWEYLLETTNLGDDYESLDDLRQKVSSGDLTAIQATAAVIRDRKYGMIDNLEKFQAWVGDVIDGNGLSESGIFFIWDEFTEYVSNSSDITLLQQLSEFSKVKPLFMMYVLHRSQEMIANVGQENYDKIGARFHGVEFHVSADAAYDLIAGSITPRTGMVENWKDACKAVLKKLNPFLPDMSGIDDKIIDKVNTLCPMHPMTIKLLARVSENYAAASRTMFRFMKDPANKANGLGFVGFIENYGPESQASWLTPDWLWDYFFTSDSEIASNNQTIASYIRHYDENAHLVSNDETALRIFKTAMLLLAVTSSSKGVYGGRQAQGGIAATVDCLKTCLAGVVSKEAVDHYLETLESSKVLLQDPAPNGVVRIQLPYRGGDGFDIRYAANDKKYTRYAMFAKDGAFSTEFEKQVWTESAASFKRMKYAVCCAETISINARLQEITKELEKSPYKLGLLIVTVSDKGQFASVQSDLAERVAKANDPRLSIAIVKTPLGDDRRKKWLTALTKQEMATDSGNTASANSYKVEAAQVVMTWVGEAATGGEIIVWNGTEKYSNIFGTSNLRKIIENNVLYSIFPYAPETIVGVSTAYRGCNEGAPLAGITRSASNSQLKSVLNGMGKDLLGLKTIEAMAAAAGTKQADSIGALAKEVLKRMTSGQRVVLGDLWVDLQRAPFGYYDTIACGVILGYIFSCYKDSAFSWTDNAQSTHVLGEATLKTMILTTCKGKMTTDYLSAGTVTFQKFREYAKHILNLKDAQVANETECWHSMREAVTQSGSPFWALKYLPEGAYGDTENCEIAGKIVDNIQRFIAQENEHETSMSTVIQLFSGRSKLFTAMRKAFPDKLVMAEAFRTYLFSVSPELKEIVEKLSVSAEELSDKLHLVMQNAIYTWTEDQVREKLPLVVSEYAYLNALNKAMKKVYHNIEDAKKDLVNLFKHLRISLSAIESCNKAWYPALAIFYKVSRSGISQLTQEEKTADIAVLEAHGRAAMECLSDAKPLLSDILKAETIDFTATETDTIYAGLKDMNCEATLTQFKKELNTQISRVSQARNRVLLQQKWNAVTNTDSVKDWCSKHEVPLLWIVPNEVQKTIRVVNDVQRNNRTLDQDVQAAIAMLSSMDTLILTDEATIEEAFIDIVGNEYEGIFKEERRAILTQAKMKISNDMSSWSTGSLITLQRILKAAQQEKAKKEKLESTKSSVRKMDEPVLRDKIVEFLNAHPEYCDDFSI